MHGYIDYKTHLNGSLVTKVPAHYTSKSCPKCGHTSDTNRSNKRQTGHWAERSGGIGRARSGGIGNWELGEREAEGLGEREAEGLGKQGILPEERSRRLGYGHTSPRLRTAINALGR
nr:transposase [Tychonema sp. LEGE 06208]